MNIYGYHIYWEYAAYNNQTGVIKADSIEEAKAKLKEAYPSIIYIPDVYELEFDEDGICILYET